MPIFSQQYCNPAHTYSVFHRKCLLEKLNSHCYVFNSSYAIDCAIILAFFFYHTLLQASVRETWLQITIITNSVTSFKSLFCVSSPLGMWPRRYCPHMPWWVERQIPAFPPAFSPPFPSHFETLMVTPTSSKAESKDAPIMPVARMCHFKGEFLYCDNCMSCK